MWKNRHNQMTLCCPWVATVNLQHWLLTVELLCQQEWALTVMGIEDAFEDIIPEQQQWMLKLLSVFWCSLWAEQQCTAVFHQHIDGDTFWFCLSGQRQQKWCQDRSLHFSETAAACVRWVLTDFCVLMMVGLESTEYNKCCAIDSKFIT